MFEDWDRESLLPDLRQGGRFVPAIDVTEDENSVALTAEIPGMEKDDLDVTVDNGVLTLRGEKKEEEEVSEETGFHRVERRYGQFERRIRLPDYVDTDRIDASYQNGVLKLTMPKTEAAKARSIQIK
jgi:HSP20 family protein